MTTCKLNQVALCRSFEIIVFVLINLFLDLQKVSEHPLLKVNKPLKLFMINRQSSNQTFLTLCFQCANGQIVCLNYLLKLHDHRFTVSLSLTQVTSIVVDVVLIAASEHLSQLKKQLEIFKLRLFQDSNHISKFDCCSLQVTNNYCKHVQYFKKRTILGFNLILSLVQELYIEGQ